MLVLTYNMNTRVDKAAYYFTAMITKCMRMTMIMHTSRG